VGWRTRSNLQMEATGGVLFQRANQHHTHRALLTAHATQCAAPSAQWNSAKEVVVPLAHRVLLRVTRRQRNRTPRTPDARGLPRTWRLCHGARLSSAPGVAAAGD
jgi:hypothetical protein